MSEQDQLNLNRETRRALAKKVNNYDKAVKKALEAEGLTIAEVKQELLEWLKIQGQIMKEKAQAKQEQKDLPQ